jgi:hypothetical protein
MCPLSARIRPIRARCPLIHTYQVLVLFGPIRGMKADSAVIAITAAALVALAVQGFGSNGGGGPTSASDDSLGLLHHPFQIVVAALHAAAHVLTNRPETAPARESSHPVNNRIGAWPVVRMGKAVGSAILRYLVVVLSLLD